MSQTQVLYQPNNLHEFELATNRRHYFVINNIMSALNPVSQKEKDQINLLSPRYTFNFYIQLSQNNIQCYRLVIIHLFELSNTFTFFVMLQNYFIPSKLHYHERQ